ncbi:hypothetical protein NDU88_005282 [Pleurodeles waltl]|uniref:Uncharacterized protein n=1 Tax=Pleurodeles waltl TaxID=8319 RepID=A0AAV7VMA3_PLEWA|nr:hypothetical protein NDU88_005282 [Pleurodeles waltl]
MIPNIPCSNRFEALAEDDETPSASDTITDDTSKEATNCTLKPVPVSPPMHLATDPSNAFILQRIEEVRSLVLQLAKCFRESLECGCKCNHRDEEVTTGHIMPDPIFPTQLAHGDQATDLQKEKTYRVGSDGDTARSELRTKQLMCDSTSQVRFPLKAVHHVAFRA